MAHLTKQYDTNGFDTGLYILDNSDDESVTPLTIINLDVRIGRGGHTVYVGQYEWDEESYLENGSIDGVYHDLGSLDCRNPYQDDMAAERLLGYLLGRDDVEHIY